MCSKNNHQQSNVVSKEIKPWTRDRSSLSSLHSGLETIRDVSHCRVGETIVTKVQLDTPLSKPTKTKSEKNYHDKRKYF